MNVIIACGGTGGHLLPGLAVAEALLARGHRVRLLVSEKAVDQVALAALTGASSRSSGTLSVTPLTAVGYTGLRRSMTFCYRLAQATHVCAVEYAAFQPAVVLGMGGFTSAPAILAARWRGVPALIHESNAVPGKANAWLGRWAAGVALGLGECAAHFGTRPTTVTGTPIRAALRGGRVAGAALRLGLVTGKLTALVVGGSQGAHAINAAVMAALPALADCRDRVQFLHLAGRADEAAVRAAYARAGFTATVLGYCQEMALAYSAADVALSRAGAATLAELAAFGVPALLVPYPQAAGNHQYCNARVLEQAGAARIVALADVAAALRAVLDDAPGRRQMAAAAAGLAVRDAEQRLANLVEQLPAGPVAAPRLACAPTTA